MTKLKLTHQEGISMSFSIPEVADDESRLYWLSFCDTDKPAGQQFLGVSIVRVTGRDVNDIALELALMFPQHDSEHGPWIAAASRKAHRLGINPGGQMLSMHIPDDCDGRPDYPEDVALSAEQLAALGVKRS